MKPLLGIAIAFLAFSCDDSQEASDSKIPDIQILSPRADQRVARSVSIELQAVDESGIKSLKIYVDGALIDARSSEVMVTELDTEKLTEGLHHLKVTAEDRNGNVREESLQFEVRNVLFSAKIPSNYVYLNEKLHYVLTQSDGKLLASVAVINGEEISIPTPQDFNPDSTFVLGIYSYVHEPRPAENAQEVVLRTRTFWTGMTAGEFKPRTPESLPRHKAPHKLELTHLAEQKSVLLTGNKVTTAWWFPNPKDVTTAYLSMYENSSDLFVQFTGKDGVQSYEYINAIHSGESSTVACCGSKEMKRSRVSTNGVGGSYNVSVFTPSWMTVFYDAGSVNTGKFDVFYPGELSSEFVYYMALNTEKNQYQNQLKASSPPTAFQYLDAKLKAFDYADRHLNLKTSGSFDVVSVLGIASIYNPDFRSTDLYSIFFPIGLKMSVVIPEPPLELSAFEFSSPTTFNFRDATFIDYLDLSVPKDYLNRIIFAEDNIPRGRRSFVRNSIYLTHFQEGGRTQSHHPAQFPLPDEALIIMEDRLPETYLRNE